MIVHKFGGTSVGNSTRFANVAQIIQQQVQNTPVKSSSATILPGIVVLVSAMSGVTDQLIAGARAAAEGKDNIYREIKARLLRKHLQVVEELLNNSPERLEAGGFIEDQLHELERLYRSIAILGELTVRGCDAVSSLGERLSSFILAAVLREIGIRAQAITASELIVTDNKFGSAEPSMKETREKLQTRVKPLIDRGIVPVITGYVAATREGITTTLGRGGSDYTAAIVGSGLDADEVCIWSDVDGILTADPNIVSQARTLSELSYAEAAELAYFGADVLHPKTIKPVVERGIPLRILNSFNPQHPGTLILKSPSPDREPLPAIISTKGLSMIAVGSTDDSWTLHMAAMALQCLSEGGVDVLLFSQSFSEHSLNLVVREENQVYCLQLLANKFGESLSVGTNQSTKPLDPQAAMLSSSKGLNLGVKEKVATISVVGLPGWNKTGIVSQAFSALGKHGTRVLAVAQAGTEFSVSFCIPEDQMISTVCFLHQELGLEPSKD
jgi:aspartokinase/homoserine dehydrogenase 1